MKSAAIAVASSGPNRLDIFGLGTDNRMYHKWYNGSWGPSHSGWEPHGAPPGGVFNSLPAVVSTGPNLLDIFCVGTANQMYHQWYNGSWGPSQTSWEPHGAPPGGPFNSLPAVVSTGPNLLDIFGMGTANQMYHQWYNGNWGPSQTGWEFHNEAGGGFKSPPAVVSTGPNRLDIFCVGTDNQMYHQWYNGSWGPSQTGWEPHGAPPGGAFNSPPAVVSTGPNRLDIFCVGTDNQMYHQWYNGSWGPSQTSWEPHGGEFNCAAAVVSTGPNLLDIFCLGANNEMRHQWYNGGWGPSITDWEDLGGVFSIPSLYSPPPPPTPPSISLVVRREDFTFTGSGWIPGNRVQVESDYPVSGSGTESIQNSYTYAVAVDGTFGDTISGRPYFTPGEYLTIAVTDAASGQSAEAEGITPD